MGALVNVLSISIIIIFNINSACWVILHPFWRLLDFFKNHLFQKSSFRNTIRVSNELDPDQLGHYVCPDLGKNCLQRLSTNNKSCCSAWKELIQHACSLS